MLLYHRLQVYIQYMYDVQQYWAKQKSWKIAYSLFSLSLDICVCLFSEGLNNGKSVYILLQPMYFYTYRTIEHNTIYNYSQFLHHTPLLKPSTFGSSKPRDEQRKTSKTLKFRPEKHYPKCFCNTRSHLWLCVCTCVCVQCVRGLYCPLVSGYHY